MIRELCIPSRVRQKFGRRVGASWLLDDSHAKYNDRRLSLGTDPYHSMRSKRRHGLCTTRTWEIRRLTGFPCNISHSRIRASRSFSFDSNQTPGFSFSSLSKRELADLEERLWKNVGNHVVDPVLGDVGSNSKPQSLASLHWLHKRIGISEDGSTLQMLLRLPSLLHPFLPELKESIIAEAQRQVRQFLEERNGERDSTSKSGTGPSIVNVNVEAIATKPVPVMARLLLEEMTDSSDDQEEIQKEEEQLIRTLGPGLVNVSHFLAVYSCKVGYSCVDGI